MTEFPDKEEFGDRDFTQEETDALETFFNGGELTPRQEEVVKSILRLLEAEEELSPEEKATQDALIEACNKDELRIVTAFMKLMEKLPGYLKHLEGWLSHLPPAPEEVTADIKEVHYFETGRPYTETLAKYGLTPLSIFYASEGISAILRRNHRRHIPYEAAVIDVTNKRFKDPEVHKIMISEISAFIEHDKATAEALLKWLIEVMAHEPSIVRGFKATTEVNTLCFVKNTDDEKSIWETPSDEA